MFETGVAVASFQYFLEDPRIDESVRQVFTLFSRPVADFKVEFW